LGPDESAVDAADEPNKSLDGTQLNESWFAQYLKRDGMLIRIKRYSAAALVARIGCDLVPMPECKNEERQEASGQCGADLPDEEQ